MKHLIAALLLSISAPLAIAPANAQAQQAETLFHCQAAWEQAPAAQSCQLVYASNVPTGLCHIRADCPRADGTSVPNLKQYVRQEYVPYLANCNGQLCGVP